MCDGPKDTSYQNSCEQRSHSKARCEVGGLCYTGEARQTMAQMRRGCCTEKHCFFRDSKLGERSNQCWSLRTSDHRFIAGELTIECHPRSREPDERMEPQDGQRNFAEQANQIVASFGVGLHEAAQRSILVG
jgi:hypothetical protein